ncbi:Asp23/Gls24 family envelope stress response protein [Oceanivirga miroungae]|uniref:Stress response regulator gls24-like protein n=1 Tax=Oceanivirga miroungae TaxID=1130046 RepID=A0A6I8MBJ9_9FUSO|nr:Asp23/Gls24 family envelope stress response protein [Oceanivirga miroungae]VWL85617.1 Stress response regulator gls24-like protein [Oceanivirga miroungae]
MNSNGKILISPDVIKRIIVQTLEDIDGVLGIAKQNKGNFFKKNLQNSLEVEMTNSECVIDMQISIVYGKNIVNISSQIQEKVKENIEKLTEITVKEINIIVVSYEKIEVETTKTGDEENV